MDWLLGGEQAVSGGGVHIAGGGVLVVREETFEDHFSRIMCVLEQAQQASTRTRSARAYTHTTNIAHIHTHNTHRTVRAFTSGAFSRTSVSTGSSESV